MAKDNKAQKKKNKKNKVAGKTAKTTTNTNSSVWILGLFIALIGFLIYAKTISFDFALDDASALNDNFVIKNGQYGDIMTKSYRYGYWMSKGTLYRPISQLMFAAEWSMKPNTPAIHHFINVLLYAFTGFLLMLTFSNIFKRYHLIFPFACCLLFIAHPVHVEVVANIKSRDEILALLFCVSALYDLWKYFDTQKIYWLVFAVLSYTLAMFSKEGAITFLAVFPLAIYCFREDWKNKIWTAGLFIIPIIVYLITRFSVLGDLKGVATISPLDNAIAAGNGLGEELATAFLFIGYYFKALFVPITLVSDLGFSQVPPRGFGDVGVLISLILFVALAVVAVWQLLKRSPIGFGLALFFATFSISSNLITLIGTCYGERLLYAPSLGFAIAFVAFLAWILKVDLTPDKGNWKTVFSKSTPFMGIIGVLVLLYAVRTHLRNPVWHSSYTLYEADIEQSPKSAKLNFHRAIELVKKGKEINNNPTKRNEYLDKGMQHFKNAIQLYPEYSDAHGELGLAYYRKKDYKNALASYEKSLAINPNKHSVYSNMGIIYFESQNYAKAKEVYQKAVEINPRFVDAWRNLGSVYAIEKNFPEAIKKFKEALKYDPNNATILRFLGSAYRDSGNTAEGKTYLDRAAQIERRTK